MKKNSKLLEALATVCRGLAITPAEARDALAPEDIEDWHQGRIRTATLAAFAHSLAQRQEREQGKVPAHYTERATCQPCGPILAVVPRGGAGKGRAGSPPQPLG